MAKKSQAAEVMSPTEKLTIRVSNMINSPKAQANRRAVIHQLDTDPDLVWEAMIEALLEVDDLTVTHNDDGTITVEWLAGEVVEQMPAEEWQVEREHI